MNGKKFEIADCASAGARESDRNTGHVQLLRPREKMLRYGAGCLSDRELLAAIIGSGTKGNSVGEIADALLKLIDRKNGALLPDDMLSISGIGTAQVTRIAAGLELSRRFLCPGRKKIAFPQDLVPMVLHYADRKQEYFLCVSLNGAHEVLAIRTVSVGLVNRAIIHPREVFSDPLTDRAAAVIIAHNHPSGNVQPSREDREVTARILESGKILGIQMLDHVIFSEEGYFSFLEEGEL